LSGFFDTKIEFLKGLGPQKAALVNKELGIFSYGELIQHYPFRYEDRTQFFKINQLSPDINHVQLALKLRQVEIIGEGRKKRLVAHMMDETGQMELTWFKGIQWVQKRLVLGASCCFWQSHPIWPEVQHGSPGT